MKVTRRDFLKFCGVSAAAVGISATDMGLLEQALANPSAPSVIWLQGASCTGCSVSFLNRISSSAPYTAADILIDSINLVYHPNIMSASGDLAVSLAEETFNKGNYILVVEGGVPTAFGGACCWAWSYNGEDVTFQEAVTGLASKAAVILCVGTCSSFGGIPASGTNPTAIKSVSQLTGKKTINISGCPTHPDWIVWTIAQLLLGNNITLDTKGRPSTLFSKTVHDRCPRKELGETHSFGVDNKCLKELGCRGPETRGNCPTIKWNNGVNWCVDANAPCIGCTEPTFPGTNAFYREGD